MKKKLTIYITALLMFSLMACSNTQTTPASSSVPSSTAPTSKVAEVKDDYVAIGGKTPYEQLTATEEQAIKKAEEEARLQAEAKAKADAEAKAKAQAEAKKQAEAQQAQANQQTEQTQEVQQGTAKGQTGTNNNSSQLPDVSKLIPNGSRMSNYEAAKILYENAPDEHSRQQAYAAMQYWKEHPEG